MLNLILGLSVTISTALTILLLGAPTRFSSSRWVSSSLHRQEYICCKCSRLFSRPASLTIHANIHTNGERHDCMSEGCSQSLVTESPLNASEVSVQVLVLGDIGRSPRMQYHALSIAACGGQVQLIGYVDSDPLPSLLQHPRVTIVPLPRPPRFLQARSNLAFAVTGPLKVLFQIWTLWLVLGYRTQAAQWLLVQNPPSIPTLAISTLICFFRSTRLIVDWHNFGYSILALRLGPAHPFVTLSKRYEFLLANLASAHFTVTNAMSRVLRRSLHLKSPVLTLHDRPASLFQPLTDAQRQSFLVRNHLLATHAADILEGRKRLLVSSTSWTPDEDFSILLEALSTYSEMATTSHPQLPEILMIITGKGPQKEHYLRCIEKLKHARKLEMVIIETAWMTFEDYASLLGSADLGVSLHTSSSGLDLPMKVVDMFGAGLPVTGWSEFEAWPELVKEDVNGKGFATANQLAEILVQLFHPGHDDLALLKRGATLEGRRRWSAEWGPVAGRLLGLVP